MKNIVRNTLVIFILLTITGYSHTTRKVRPGSIYRSHKIFKTGDPIFYNHGDIFTCKESKTDLGHEGMFDSRGFLKRACFAGLHKGIFLFSETRDTGQLVLYLKVKHPLDKKDMVLITTHPEVTKLIPEQFFVLLNY